MADDPIDIQAAGQEDTDDLLAALQKKPAPAKGKAPEASPTVAKPEKAAAQPGADDSSSGFTTSGLADSIRESIRAGTVHHGPTSQVTPAAKQPTPQTPPAEIAPGGNTAATTEPDSIWQSSGSAHRKQHVDKEPTAEAPEVDLASMSQSAAENSLASELSDELASVDKLNEADLMITPAAAANQATPATVAKKEAVAPVSGNVKKTIHIGPTTELQPIRTFESDMVNAVRSQRATLASIAIGAMNKREREHDIAVAAPKRNRLLLIGSLITIVLAVAILLYIFVFHQTEEEPLPPAAIAPHALVFSESEKYVDLTDMEDHEARDAIASHLNTDRRAGTIEHTLFYVNVVAPDPASPGVPTVLDTQSLFAALGSSADEQMFRLLSKTFMYGIHTTTESNGFFILKPEGFQIVFAEMLDYEPRISQELYRVLTGKAFPKGIVTDNSQPTGIKKWQDRIIRNIDTRALVDDNDNIVMLYAFMPTKDMLIITASEATFLEVLTRLQTPDNVTR